MPPKLVSCSGPAVCVSEHFSRLTAMRTLQGPSTKMTFNAKPERNATWHTAGSLISRSLEDPMSGDWKPNLIHSEVSENGEANHPGSTETHGFGYPLFFRKPPCDDQNIPKPRQLGSYQKLHFGMSLQVKSRCLIFLLWQMMY